MATIKYDFPKLKLEFMQSDIPEVKMFFESKFNRYNVHIQKNSKGWTKEKQEYKKLLISKAEAKFRIEEEKQWWIVFKNISKARMSWIQEIWKRLTNWDKLSKMQLRDITDALKHLRLEVWETTENIKTVKVDEDPLWNRLEELRKAKVINIDDIEEDK